MTRWACFFYALIAAAQSNTTSPVSIDGTVISAGTGTPVRKAHVTLEPAATGENEGSGFIATTDEAGHFRFAALDAGVYRLTTGKPGFLTGGYGQPQADGEPTLLRVKAGDRVQGLMLKLFPAGTLSGRILDADGDPAPGRKVLLWHRHTSHGETFTRAASETDSNAAGDYRFENLASGTYFVSAEADLEDMNGHQIPVDREGKATRIHELKTFYPSSLSIARAQALRLESGEELTGIDLQIQTGTLLSVKGRITGADAASLSQYQLNATIDAGRGWSGQEGSIQPDGDFVINNLQSGDHRLSLLRPSPNGPQEVGTTDITLPDRDLTGVTMALFRPAQVRVRVVMEEGQETVPLTMGSVFLIPDPPESNPRNSISQFTPQNGVYVMDSVAPGKYRVEFSNASSCYLKSLQAGGRTLPVDSFEVPEGATLNLLMTYSRNVATVTGDVSRTEDQAGHPAHVFLIAREALVSRERTTPADLDQSSQFTLNHMTPGSYLAIATEESDQDAWDNADFLKLLQSEAAAIDLHENEHATLHLKLIPKETTSRIRQQLGL